MKLRPNNIRRVNSPARLILGLALCLILSQGCSDEYDVIGTHSPGPGILRITLTSDEMDNFLVIAGDTVRVEEGGSDSLSLVVGQGRAYRGVDYAVLFKNLNDYQELTKVVNGIRWDDSTFHDYVIFETYLPPANYDSLIFALSSEYLQIGFYSIPLQPVADGDPFVRSYAPFRIEEGRTTVVRFQLKPFQSLQRVGDAYQYSWDIAVLGIEYQ